MESKETLLQVCKDYLSCFPSERERLSVFEEYLKRNKSDQLYTRKNFDGHIAASVFVISSKLSKVLLVHHKTLDRWLQPGGHVDEIADPNILGAALRECQEETGLSEKMLSLVRPAKNIYLPFDIDSHLIPRNDKKNEDSHYHHDFRFLFVHDGESEVTINTDESKGYEWQSLSKLSEDQEFELVVDKIANLLAEKKKAV